jgi:hypothetical protein
LRVPKVERNREGRCDTQWRMSFLGAAAREQISHQERWPFTVLSIISPSPVKYPGFPIQSSTLGRLKTIEISSSSSTTNFQPSPWIRAAVLSTNLHGSQEFEVLENRWATLYFISDSRGKDQSALYGKLTHSIYGTLLAVQRLVGMPRNTDRHRTESPRNSFGPVTPTFGSFSDYWGRQPSRSRIIPDCCFCVTFLCRVRARQSQVAICECRP